MDATFLIDNKANKPFLLKITNIPDLKDFIKEVEIGSYDARITQLFGAEYFLVCLTDGNPHETITFDDLTETAFGVKVNMWFIPKCAAFVLIAIPAMMIPLWIMFGLQQLFVHLFL